MKTHTGAIPFQVSIFSIALLCLSWNFELLPRFKESTLEKTLLGKNINQVVQDSHKNWIVGGQYNNKYFIEKNGLWTKTYFEDELSSWIDVLAVDKYNNINAGIINQFENGFSYEIHKYNPNGNLGWKRTLIQTNHTFTGRIVLVSDKDGNIYSSVKEHSATVQTTITKFDLRGDQFWTHSMDIDDEDWSLAIAKGKLVVAANNALWIASSSGIQSFGTSLPHNAGDVVTDKDENILVCGHTQDGDIMVSKWNARGEELWAVEHSKDEEAASKLISCETGLDNTIHIAIQREDQATLDVMHLHSKDGSILWNDSHRFESGFVLNDMFFNKTAESFKVIVTLATTGESILLKWNMPPLPIAFIGLCIFYAFDFLQLFLLIIRLYK